MVQYNREASITVRCDNELKEQAEQLAREKGQSLVEWIRRAIKEKIDRDVSSTDEAQIEETVRRILLKMRSEGKQ